MPCSRDAVPIPCSSQHHFVFFGVHPSFVRQSNLSGLHPGRPLRSRRPLRLAVRAAGLRRRRHRRTKGGSLPRSERFVEPAATGGGHLRVPKRSDPVAVTRSSPCRAPEPRSSSVERFFREAEVRLPRTVATSVGFRRRRTTIRARRSATVAPTSTSGTRRAAACTCTKEKSAMSPSFQIGHRRRFGVEGRSSRRSRTARLVRLAARTSRQSLRARVLVELGVEPSAIGAEIPSPVSRSPSSPPRRRRHRTSRGSGCRSARLTSAESRSVEARHPSRASPASRSRPRVDQRRRRPRGGPSGDAFLAATRRDLELLAEPAVVTEEAARRRPPPPSPRGSCCRDAGGRVADAANVSAIINCPKSSQSKIFFASPSVVTVWLSICRSAEPPRGRHVRDQGNGPSSRRRTRTPRKLRQSLRCGRGRVVLGLAFAPSRRCRPCAASRGGRRAPAAAFGAFGGGARRRRQNTAAAATAAGHRRRRGGVGGEVDGGGGHRDVLPGALCRRPGCTLPAGGDLRSIVCSTTSCSRIRRRWTDPSSQRVGDGWSRRRKRKSGNSPCFRSTSLCDEKSATSNATRR